MNLRLIILQLLVFTTSTCYAQFDKINIDYDIADISEISKDGILLPINNDSLLVSLDLSTFGIVNKSGQFINKFSDIDNLEAKFLKALNMQNFRNKYTAIKLEEIPRPIDKRKKMEMYTMQLNNDDFIIEIVYPCLSNVKDSLKMEYDLANFYCVFDFNLKLKHFYPVLYQNQNKNYVESSLKGFFMKDSLLYVGKFGFHSDSTGLINKYILKNGWFYFEKDEIEFKQPSEEIFATNIFYTCNNINGINYINTSKILKSIEGNKAIDLRLADNEYMGNIFSLGDTSLIYSKITTNPQDENVQVKAEVILGKSNLKTKKTLCEFDLRYFSFLNLSMYKKNCYIFLFNKEKQQFFVLVKSF